MYTHQSWAKKIICGVLQESILGPLTFLLDINDLPECQKNKIPDMYADDTQTCAFSLSFSDLIAKLNQDLENIICLSHHKLLLNKKRQK